ncbi:hypothetical protein F1735_15670, partial [Massilia sp. CCM 8694]|nr:hypothetical protein [Massilia genomosp. 1]
MHCRHHACNATKKKPGLPGFFYVRPAWAHSWRCKSSRKLTTVSEVKRNCGRATDCGEEAWSETA